MPTEARDTTALVLSLGEPTLADCLAALRAQTLPPAEIVLIEGVQGFHEAFNRGLARVATDYVLQCDADMLLDPDCLAVLRASMAPGLGVCATYLDDALLGRIQAVRLFRTAAIVRSGLPPRLNTDIHLRRRQEAAGWVLVQPRLGAAVLLGGTILESAPGPNRATQRGRMARAAAQ